MVAKATHCYDRQDFELPAKRRRQRQALALEPDCSQALLSPEFVFIRTGGPNGRSEASAGQGPCVKIPIFKTAWEKRGDAPVQNVFFSTMITIPFYQEQFYALLALAREAVPKSYDAIADAQWNLHYPGLIHPLTVQAKEITSDTLVRWKVAYVQPVGRGNGLRQFLVNRHRQLHSKPARQLQPHRGCTKWSNVIIGDVEAGTGRACRFRLWFNEGFAQSVTTEGRWRVQEEMAEIRRTGEPALECDIDGPVDEFAHGPFNAKCYSEFYLSVQYLRHLGGSTTLVKVLSGLRQGTPMTDLIYSLTGKASRPSLF